MQTRGRSAPVLATPHASRASTSPPRAIAPRGRVLSLGYDDRGALSAVLELRDLPEGWCGMVDIDLLRHDGVVDSRAMALASTSATMCIPIVLRYDAHAVRNVVGWRVAGRSNTGNGWSCDARVDEWLEARRGGAHVLPALCTQPEYDDQAVVVTGKRGVFHLPSCVMAKYARLNRTIDSPQHALRAGYRPCQRCLPP